MLTQEQALAITMDAFQLGLLQSGLEARDFAQWISGEDISNILEIGTRFGGSLYLMDRAAKAVGHVGYVISVDHPWGHRDVNSPPHEALFHEKLSHVIEIFGNAHDEATLEQAVRTVSVRHPLDLLFIDSDHSRAGTKAQVEKYGRLVRPGGFIGFHDIANGHECQGYYDEEIRPNFWTITFTEPKNLYGIGVCQLPPGRSIEESRTVIS